MTWDSILQKRMAKYPSELLVRFVARNYYGVADRSKVHFLDLGSGSGANLWYLFNEGYRVTGLDGSDYAIAHIHTRIEDYTFPFKTFDCIIDHNTLCHVKTPPMERIRAALKEGGKFFSVAPTSETWKGHLDGKGYCRCAMKRDLEDLYKSFSKVSIGRASYPDRNRQITSWVVEAVK